MAERSVFMEVERVMNLVQGFGWKKVGEQVAEDEIHLEMKKEPEETGIKTVNMEVSRVMNLVQGFGWEKVKEELKELEIHITIMKKSLAAAETGPDPGPT